MRKPKPGERFAKVVTNRRGVTAVQSRTVRYVAQCGVFYTPKRVSRYASFREWRAWAKGAHKCQ